MRGAPPRRTLGRRRSCSMTPGAQAPVSARCARWHQRISLCAARRDRRGATAWGPCLPARAAAQAAEVAAERLLGCFRCFRGLRERLRGWLGHGYAEPRRADRPVAALRPCDPRVHALAARATHAGDRHALLSLPRLEAHRGPAGGAGLQPRLELAARDDREHARRRGRDRLHHRQPAARGPALPRRRAPRRRLGPERRIGDPSGNRGLQARLGGHEQHLPRRHRTRGRLAVPGSSWRSTPSIRRRHGRADILSSGRSRTRASARWTVGSRSSSGPTTTSTR